MFLTPCECAQIMSEIKNKEVSVRKVYYLLESFELLAVKIGNSCKITIQELEEYYERRDPRCAGIVRELAGNIKSQRGGGCFQRKPNHYPSIDIQEEFKCVQNPGRAGVEYQQVRFKKVYRKKRNDKQLEFCFSA
ncbi:helix-turn-helix domain-containing protein [Treponema phagedenis]|uniref:helix-turn-helix domain-containing protein n=1 Tax=Treponema phagedenis TaxID=162 RepID=UPI0020919179|nr:helix-turn-helix domain-containing protein [Treponema phagedenis]